MTSKVSFATTKCAFQANGSYMEIQQSYFYLLDQSSDNVPVIKDDDLLQIAQPWVIDNATKDNQETANIIHQKLTAKFPSHKISVFCWNKNLS